MSNKVWAIGIGLFLFIISIPAQNALKETSILHSENTVKALLGHNQEKKNKALQDILASPNEYNPTVLYAFSSVLFKDGKKDLASYWYYVAQIRARYDAILSQNTSSVQTVSILNQTFGAEINSYSIENMENLKITIKNAVEFVQKNEENYDHRWIIMNGEDAENNKNKELAEPRANWKKLKETMLKDYYSGFLKAMSELNK